MYALINPSPEVLLPRDGSFVGRKVALAMGAVGRGIFWVVWVGQALRAPVAVAKKRGKAEA